MITDSQLTLLILCGLALIIPLVLLLAKQFVLATLLLIFLAWTPTLFMDLSVNSGLEQLAWGLAIIGTVAGIIVLIYWLAVEKNKVSN